MADKPLCRICGKLATGVHYQVLACAGCKSFYQRAVMKKANYKCYFGGNCSTEANDSSLVRCKACRFWKFAVLCMTVRVSGAAKTEKPRASLKRASVSDISTENEAVWTCPKVGLDVSINLPVETSKDGSLSPDCRTSNGSDSSSGSENGDPPQAPDQDISSAPESASMENNFVMDCTVPDDIDCHINPLSYFDPASPSSLVPLYHIENFDRTGSTISAVAEAIQVVFGDHLAKWTTFKNSILKDGLVVPQPQTSVDNLVMAINKHSCDTLTRILRFAQMCPGLTSLDSVEKRAVISPWKMTVTICMHHAPFMTPSDSYVTLGEDELQYCRYWQRIISDPPLVVFLYKFCDLVREIGLDQTELYLLMAVVLFEPTEDGPSGYDCHLREVHHHYIDLLMYMIRRRCGDTPLFRTTMQRLEVFFNRVKQVHAVERYYQGRPPLSMVSGFERIRQWQLAPIDKVLRSCNAPERHMATESYLTQGNI